VPFGTFHQESALRFQVSAEMEQERSLFEVFRFLKPKIKLDLRKDYEQATLGSSALPELKINGISEFSCKLVRTLCCDTLAAARRRGKRSSQRLLG
jgi:hypothetical protein